nr:DNA alkylation repair protein [Gemmatimonadaceae bacterium]
ASRRADIPRDVLARLNEGTLETATLAEGLAIDFATLLGHAVPRIGDDALASMAAAQPAGVTRRMAVAGTLLLERLGLDGARALGTHPSDTVRGWVAYAIAAAPGRTLAERLTMLRPLADDPHFGVREWAWLAVRPHVADDVPGALTLLAPWVLDPRETTRRFAIELTRPRGVWSPHLAPLVRDPALALPLLDPVRADPARYVQDSVANWLNDAGKSSPDFVRTLCARWRSESPVPATTYICRRAQRSLA